VGDYPGCGMAFEITSWQSPTTTSFATQLDFTRSAPKTIYLNNYTAAPMTGISTSFTGANAADFSITGGTCGSTPAQLSYCTYKVVFTPSIAGAETASLVVTDSDGTQTAALKGLGNEAKLPPSKLSFGTVANPATKILSETVTNIGTTPLTFEGSQAGIAETGTQYYFVQPYNASGPQSTCLNGTVTLTTGQSCTVSVMFAPSCNNPKERVCYFKPRVFFAVSEATSVTTLIATS
jgi:hypothetical protein